jgi:hypothetical protein
VGTVLTAGPTYQARGAALAAGYPEFEHVTGLSTALLTKNLKIRSCSNNESLLLIRPYGHHNYRKPNPGGSNQNWLGYWRREHVSEVLAIPDSNLKFSLIL